MSGLSEENRALVERLAEDGWRCCGCGAPPPFICDCPTGCAYLPGRPGSRWKSDLISPPISPARDELLKENERLRLAILGGEDVPGVAMSLPLDDVLKALAENYSITTYRAEAAEAALQSAEARLAEAATTLAQIDRMKLFPDDKINRTTLQAAIHLARSCLNTLNAPPTSGGSEPS